MGSQSVDTVHPGTQAFKKKDWTKLAGLQKTKAKQQYAGWAFFSENQLQDTHTTLDEMKEAPQEHVRLDAETPEFKPQPGFPLSKFIPQPKDWADAAVLVPHECLRWLLGQMIDAQQELLQNADSIDAATLSWKVKNVLLFAHHFWVPILHHHHMSEEYIYLPFINGCAPHEGDLPEALTDHHEDLVNQLDRMATLIHEGETLIVCNNHLRSKLFLRAFLVVCLEQAQTFTHHCDHQEMLLPDLLRKNASETQHAIVTKVVGASLGWAGSAFFVPFILHRMVLWAGDEFTEWFFNNELQLPMRMLYMDTWQPAFQNVVLNLLESIRPREDLLNDPFPQGVVGCPYGLSDTWTQATTLDAQNR